MKSRTFWIMYLASVLLLCLWLVVSCEKKESDKNKVNMKDKIYDTVDLVLFFSLRPQYAAVGDCCYPICCGALLRIDIKSTESSMTKTRMQRKTLLMQSLSPDNQEKIFCLCLEEIGAHGVIGCISYSTTTKQSIKS